MLEADRIRTGASWMPHGRGERSSQLELQFALSPRPHLLIVNQTIPSTYSTQDAKENLQDCKDPIQPHILVTSVGSGVASAFSSLIPICPCGTEQTPAGG